MPLPKPDTSESRDDYIQRCMGDDVAVEEYPDNDQRMAVCQAQWTRAQNRGNARKPQIRNQGPAYAEVLLYGDIGGGLFDNGVGAPEFIDIVESLGTVESLDVRINSAGGDVFEGFAIYNYLDRHQAEVTTYVDGMALSIASVIAMAGNERIMASNAVMMIHEPYTIAMMGNAEELRKEADVLELIGENIANIYLDRSTLTAKQIKAMMADETWLNIDDAFASNFVTTVGKSLDIAAHFDLSKFRHPPDFAQARKDHQETAHKCKQWADDLARIEAIGRYGREWTV